MSEVDGWITIGTKLDNNELEKQYRKLTSELEKKQKENEQLAKIKLKVETDYEQAKAEIEEFTNERLARARSDEEANEALLTEERSLKKLNEEYSGQFEKIKEINNKINENVNSQELLKQQIEKTNQELQKTRHFNEIKKSINDVGKSVQRVTKQIIHWGLAIFGVRSAYLFVRQAMSTLSGYNEQLATDLQYIRFVLASTLEPLIMKIVEWAYKLLSIVGTIIRTLTGYNIFKNSGVDKFQKSLNKSANSAKEIKKQLAGFDEMNILNDNSGGADAGGATLPSQELNSNVPLPKWMEDLMAHGKDIIAIILGIVGAIKLLELGLAPIQALGLGIAIIGVVYAIMSLLDYLKDPSWEHFGQIIQGIGLAVAGLGIAFLGLPVAIAGIAIAIVGIIIEHWEEIKALFMKAIDWLTEKMNEVEKKYGFFAGLIIKGVRDFVLSIVNMLDTIFVNAKGMLDNIIKFFDNVFKGKWKEAWNNLVNIAKNAFNIILAFLDGGINMIKSIFITTFGVIGDVIGGIIIGAINKAFSYIESKINTAISMFNGVLSFVNKLPGVSIKKIGYVSLPRLARGTIVNAPGKGVLTPSGNAIYGESGPEAYLPLSDTRLLEQLGSTIGKYITINATVVNSMNGRVLSREIQKVQNESNFAMNR